MTEAVLPVDCVDFLFFAATMGISPNVFSFLFFETISSLEAKMELDSHPTAQWCMRGEMQSLTFPAMFDVTVASKLGSHSIASAKSWLLIKSPFRWIAAKLVVSSSILSTNSTAAVAQKK